MGVLMPPAIRLSFEQYLRQWQGAGGGGAGDTRGQYEAGLRGTVWAQHCQSASEPPPNTYKPPSL